MIPMDEIEWHEVHYHHNPKQKERNPRIISEHHTHSHEKTDPFDESFRRYDNFEKINSRCSMDSTIQTHMFQRSKTKSTSKR